MSNIDKQAIQAVADLKAGYTLGRTDVAILNELVRIALALLDELEAKDQRIADQRETLLAARSHVMQCARLGDAHASGVLQAIDRAAAGKGDAS